MFFTRIPISSDNLHDDNQLSQALKYFPLIGIFVGGFCAFTFYLSSQIWPMTISVIVSMTAGLLLTGALHEDGFADSCDAFGGGWNKEQILVIMKDPRIGSYGAMGLIMLTLGKAIVLIELAGISTGQLMLSLIVAHSASRFMALLIPFKLDYVQDATKSKSKSMMARRFSRSTLLFSGAFVAIPLLIINDSRLIFAIIPALLATLGLGYYFKRRIGGYSGDCLGATQQISEMIIYLSILGLWTSP